MEHRWGQRHRVRHRVQLRTREGAEASGWLLNVSISGALILTPLHAPLLTHITIDFEMRDQDDFPDVLEAQVVRPTPNGFAVEWTEFAAPTLRALVPPALSETSAGTSTSADTS